MSWTELMTGPNKSVCIYTVSSGRVCRVGCLLLGQPSHLTVVTSADGAHSCTSHGHKFPLQLSLKCLSSTKTPVTSWLPLHADSQPLLRWHINTDLARLLINSNALLGFSVFVPHEGRGKKVKRKEASRERIDSFCICNSVPRCVSWSNPLFSCCFSPFLSVLVCTPFF